MDMHQFVSSFSPLKTGFSGWASTIKQSRITTETLYNIEVKLLQKMKFCGTLKLKAVVCKSLTHHM